MEKHLIQINDYTVSVIGREMPNSWSFIRDSASGRIIHIVLNSIHKKIEIKGKYLRIVSPTFEHIHIHISERDEPSKFYEIVEEISNGKFDSSTIIPGIIRLTEFIVRGSYIFMPTQPYRLWYIDPNKDNKVCDFVTEIKYRDGDKIFTKQACATSDKIKIFLYEGDIKGIKDGEFIETNEILQSKFQMKVNQISAYQRWTQQVIPLEGSFEENI